MSRCYPFPPPGYEYKNRIDDVDVLAKEKHKEKKHKKDKDRERKDGKVKKEKDRSKEKRDHRDKHKHKKDRKEKSKEKEKNHGTLNDKKPEVRPNSVNGVGVDSKALQSENHNSGNPNHVEELARRIRVDGQATGSQIVPKTTADEGGKVNSVMMNSNSSLALAKRMVDKEIVNASGGLILQNVRLVDRENVQIDRRTNGRNGCFPAELDQIGKIRQVDDVHGTMEFSHLQGLTKRTVEKEKNGLEVQIARRIRLVDETKDDGNGCYIAEPNGERVNGRVVNVTMDAGHLQVSAKRNSVNGKNGFGGHIVQKVGFVDQAKVQINTRTGDGKEKRTRVDHRASNGGRNFEEAMNIGNVGAYAGIAKPPEAKDVRVDSEGTDRGKHGRESSYKMEKRESKDRDDNRSELKDKVGDKERKTDERLKKNGELGEGAIKGLSEQNYDTCSVNLKQNGQSTGKILAGAGNLGKRKELEMNGFRHENGTRPHKLQRPAAVASSPRTLENVRKTESCQTGEHKTEEALRKVIPRSPLPITKKASSVIRPPHPDSALLNQVLSLPEPDRTPVFDDQEWLFCNTSSSSRRRREESLSHGIREPDSSERHQVVWDHGIWIESADIFTLPYVIPY